MLLLIEIALFINFIERGYSSFLDYISLVSFNLFAKFRHNDSLSSIHPCKPFQTE